MADLLGVSESRSRTGPPSNIPCRGQILGWTGLIRVDGKSYVWYVYPEPIFSFDPETEYWKLS